MGNKVKKTNWTKKFKALFISISLALAVALGGACAAIGIAVAGRNGRLGGTFAGGVADENIPQLPEPVETFTAGATVDGVTYTHFASAWAGAVNYSKEHDGAVVQFDLNKTWTAAAEGGFSSAETYPDAYGAAGSLNVPEGASVILNISRNVRLDRVLASADAIENGEVITVSGTLYITGNGTITGGNTTGNGAGINGKSGSSIEIYGANVSNNKSGFGGGGINVSGTLAMLGGTVTGNTARNGGGIYVITSGSCKMLGGTVSENTATSTTGGKGGGICVNGALTMEGGVVSNNTAESQGGGVYINSEVTFTMNGGTVSDNVAEFSGGGIEGNKSSKIIINNGNIINNSLSSTSTSGGGGIHTMGTLNITGGSIANNSSPYGGGVYMSVQDTQDSLPEGQEPIYHFTMSGGEITGNTATVNGGGVYYDSGNYSLLEGGTISNNTADSSGGGISIGIDNNCVITDTSISGNSSGSHGGGIYSSGALTMTGGKITNNKASEGSGTGYGGGLYLTDGSAEISGGTISDNAAGNGGGICAVRTTFKMTDGTVENNKALWRGDPNGAGIYLNGGNKDTPVEERLKTEISGGAIKGNECSNAGGGLFLTGGAELTFSGVVVVSGNKAKNGGALLAEYNSNATINGGEFTNNSATNVGGAFNFGIGSNITMTDGTITNNTAVNTGGGISLVDGLMTMTGGEISNNSANASGGIHMAGSGTDPITVKLYGGLISGNVSSTGGVTRITGKVNIYIGMPANTVDGNAEIISTCVFRGNESTVGGGVFDMPSAETYADKPKEIYVNGGTFTENRATGAGVFFAERSANYHISKATFEDNGCNDSANYRGNGGTIIINAGGTVSISDSTFTGNHAVNGGAIYTNGTLNLTNVTITDNTAYNNGGGIYYAGGTINLNGKIVIKDNTSCDFTNNFFRANNNSACIAKTLDTASEIWISANVNTPVINVPSQALTARVFNDNPAYWTRTDVAKTGGTYDVTLAARTDLGTNAARWAAAVNNSSTGNPQLFEMTENWTAASGIFGSGTGYNSSGSLAVPAGKEVILDLKNYTLSKGTGQTKAVIYIDGKLTIKGSGTITGGGASSIVVNQNGTLIFNGGTISGNSSRYSGGGVYTAGIFTMNGGTISNNTAGTGGGVFVTDTGTFTMNGGTIGGSDANKNTASEDGGGVYNNGGTFTMNGGTISYNVSNSGSNGGGGILSRNGTFTMMSGTVSYNTAINSAGGILVWGGEHSITGGTVSNNTAGANGGGILVDKGTIFTMDGGTISGNTASRRGGGVAVNGGTFNFNDGKIVNNTIPTAGSGGGGVYVTSGGKFTMKNGTISGNTSNTGGGGVLLYEEDETVTNSKIVFTMDGGTISDNVANSNFGGGVAVNTVGTTFNMNAGSIANNSANGTGGGVNIAPGATFTMNGGKISGNTAEHGGGGGVFVTGLSASFTMSGGEISDNTAVGYSGGGVRAVENSSFIMNGGTISNNKAQETTGGGGGGVLASDGTIFTMNEGNIVNNSATGTDTTGGGVLSSGTFEMHGGTISGNLASSNGGGVSISRTSTFTMTAGSISDNTATTFGGGVFVTGTATLIVSGGTISDNTAANGGGVFIAKGATFKMGEVSGSGASATYSGNGVISGNTTKMGYGGGVYVDGGVVNSVETAGYFYLYGGTVMDNEATYTSSDDTTYSGGRGGAIYVQTSAYCGIYGGTISGNKGSLGGGVFVYQRANIHLLGGNINKNTAINGGGIFVGVGSALHWSGSVISDNTATLGGGAYIQGIKTNSTITGGVASNNTATNGGGIAFINIDTLSLTNIKITDNVADTQGGGIYSRSETGYEGKLIFGTSDFKGAITVSGNTATRGGGIFAQNGVLELYSCIISNNSAVEGVPDGENRGGHGGGIYAGNTVMMYGGTVSNNTANGNGGGLCIGLIEMYGGSIIDNEVIQTYSSSTDDIGMGGGIAVGESAKIHYGKISGNTATYGGGIWVKQNATLTMDDGLISENTAITYGGGVYNSGTSVMSNGEIVGNTSQNGGGGIYSRYGGKFTLANGTISNNTASNGGGLYANSAFVMNGGEITKNTASNNGGGVFVNGGSFSVSGKVIITENALKDGVVCNYASAGAVPITVAGALNNESRIGIYNEVLPLTATGGYTSSGNTAANARNIFSADKEGVVAVYENNEIVLKQGVVLTVNDDEGNKLGSISTVNGAKVLGAFDEETRIYSLSESGAAANTSGFAFASDAVPAGYAAYMYAYGDVNKTEITEFTMGSANATVCLTKKALEREYTIHYYIQSADGTYGTTFITGTNSGLTDSAVVVVDEDGKPFTTQISTPEQYSVDTTQGDWQTATVAGDGSTVVEVYLKLNEYTVTFSAAGASNIERARTLRYGAAITEPTRVPVKALSSFDYWSYDEAGENRVDFTTAKVTGNVTLYAQFTTRKFNVTFNLNVGDGDGQIPAANSLKLAAIPGGNIHGDKILWDIDTLFDESFGFKAVDAEAGEYEITYTIDNVSSNKRINGIIPTAIGYTFGGWFEEGASRATTVIRTPDEYTDEVITLTAKWSRTQYAVRFDAQNGTRVTSKTVPNITAWDSILTEPERGGYEFQGWFVTTDKDSDNYLTTDEISRSRDSEGRRVFSISDFVARGICDPASTTVTLYAEWESMPVRIETVEDEEKGGMSFAMDGSDLSDTNPIVYIGREVTVTVDANPGYRFKNLVIHYLQNGSETRETLRDGVTSFTVASRFVRRGTDELSGEEYSFIKIEAEYSEQRYTITYHTDGGRAEDTSFARSYSASELLEGSANRAKLPSRLTKNGWDFAGWIFESTEEWPNPQFAHASVAEGESYYGAELWLVQPYSLDDAQEATFRNVTLKAVWTPQTATVYLYNATYTDNIQYRKDDVNNYYYIVEDDSGDPLVTESKIDIVNPVRDSFDFLGWATSRNGAVVYPASDDSGVTTIEYVVNPDHDASGSALNRNNLYAVWHVKGVNYIIMSADNNGATYGGDGITMTAKPAQSYTDNDANIMLHYHWYKVYDGMYDQCFTVTDYVDADGFMWYLDESGNIVSYEKDGVYYDEHKEVIPAPVGIKFTVKDFNPAAVGEYCEERFTRQNVAASETPAVKVENVVDSGIYICYVEVVATEESGTTTRSGGYGEIEITMNKAVFGGLSMADARVEYNTKSRADEVAISGLAVSTENGLRVITLPDGSKVNVTYTYYMGAGELKENDPRQPITDLSLIKNVGEYHVVASFEFAVGGDKGNYEPLESLEADLYILADVLSVFEYPFMHDGEAIESKDYTGVYDGKAYGIDVVIKDTLSINAGSQLVTDVDDVAVDYKVYLVTPDRDVEITAENLPTVDAGTYAMVIVGLKGGAKDNYVLGSGVELRHEYTIGKMKYDVADHIHFNDVDNVVFDNEIHTLSVSFDDGYALPDTVTATYTTEYIPEDSEFVNGRLTNNADDNNGGRYAGTYNITVTFTDTAESNHEALESMSATLTIKKADFFDFYNVDGRDVLRDGGFVSRSTAFRVGVSYNPHILSGMLVDTENFGLKYTYYRVDGQTKADLSDGAHTQEELEAMGDLISIAGKYEIVAHITYNSPLYRNNFEEISESDSTITYEISGVPVESVEVVFKSGFEADGRVVKLGESFDYGVIDHIDVKYEGEAGTSTISRPEDILLANVRFETNGAERNTFWHVGKFNVYVSFYDTESVAYEFTVKEEVAEFVLKYKIDNGAYEVVPEGGLELLTDGRVYSFIIEYSCTGENGGVITTSSDATVAEGGLALGVNELRVTEDYYTFGKVSVNMYEVLNDLNWQYSTDGENWEDVPETNELTYAGKAYMLRAVYGEGANQKTFVAHTLSGADALNVGSYVMAVGITGNYRIDEEYSFRITQKKLAFVWDKNSFEYDMLSHTPAMVSSGVEEIDEGLVTFSLTYYDANKSRIPANSIVTVGTYYLSVTLGGDLTARGNYTIADAENAEYFEFAITRATINATVYYSESNYGRNITFAGNTELRLGAMKADFGENAQVAGQFRFIEPTEDSYTIIDGKSFADALKTSGALTVNYMYVPDNKNYDELTGVITLDVKTPDFKTGEGALSVEFGNGAIQFYLVNQTLDTDGIEVYRLYESTYVENGVWYGARELIENPVFRLKGYNGSIENYKITSLDLSGGSIVLIARDGKDSGELSIPVIDKTPTGIEVANPDEYRKTYYVGEIPDFNDIVFRVLFDNETPAVEVNVGTIKSDYTGGALTEDVTTFTVNFTYFSISLPLTFSVAPKEELTVVKPADTVLNYTGAEIAVPELKFTVDGKTYGQNELDGVEVGVAIYFVENETTRRPVTHILGEGKYSIVYTFEISNPRFNAHDPVNVDIEVTTNPYTVERTLPENSQTSFTGKDIEVPKPTIGQVTDSTAGGEAVAESRIIRVYEIFDEKENRTWEVKFGDAWTVRHSGRYVITVTVRVAQSGGAEPFTAWSGSYELVVTQAQNDVANASISGPEIIVKGSDGSVDLDVFKITADFGAENVIWEYSTSRDGGYSTTKPTAVGTYYVRARIIETDDYQGLTTLGQVFEIRDESIELGGGEGSVSGENGIGKDWTLEIKQIGADEVSQVAIDRQNVLDGYKVELKKANGEVVKDQGDYTVRIKLSDELKGNGGLKVFFKDADGNTREMNARVDGDYIEFTASDFTGEFFITNAVAGAPVGLLVAVIVLAVVAAGMITACVIVFVKKKRKGAQ